MKRLFLVRHGQASFLSANYDQLSATGRLQSRLLGEYWKQAGPRQPARVFSGSLQRQIDTAAGIVDAWAANLAPMAPVSGLNEFPFERLIEQWLPKLKREDEAVRLAADTASEARAVPDRYRAVQALLEVVMLRWQEQAGRIELDDVPPWPEFVQRSSATINDLVRETAGDASVVIVTSGGVIAAFTTQVMSCDPTAAIALSWHLKNASVSEFQIDAGGPVLRSYNNNSHLPMHLQTYR